MRRGRALASVLAAAALAASSPRGAAAQSDAPDCVAIVAEMLAPAPSAGAIRASAGCPATGPVTLASRWTRRGARAAGERAALVEASSLMRDARLYEAVSAVVRDAGYPRADRLAGMRVLVGYADEEPGVIQQGQVYGAKAAELSGGRPADATMTVAGSNALPPTVREDIKRELSRLAREDKEPDVRWAAQRACESLGYVAPRGAKVARYPTP
ncbi:MAG TPA: hypothetical protein VFS59_08610 [Gemmatimonadaceae bacterium]|nr:hypothetical protein [Gemmatimonadaceae bacterium]